MFAVSLSYSVRGGQLPLLVLPILHVCALSKFVSAYAVFLSLSCLSVFSLLVVIFPLNYASATDFFAFPVNSPTSLDLYMDLSGANLAISLNQNISFDLSSSFR